MDEVKHIINSLDTLFTELTRLLHTMASFLVTVATLILLIYALITVIEIHAGANVKPQSIEGGQKLYDRTR